MNQKLSEQELVRRESLEKIIALGINPYPPELFELTTNSLEIKNQFNSSDSIGDQFYARKNTFFNINGNNFDNHWFHCRQ